MKKICHITTVHSLLDTRIFYKECQTLVKHGYDVSLIVQYDDSVVIDGVKIIPLPEPKNRLYRMLFLTRKAYKLALEQKADIYHFHDPEFLPWAVRLKKKTGAKIIYDIHEDYPKQILSKHWIPNFLRKLIANLFSIYEKRKVKKIDYLITVGEDVKKRLETINSNIEILKNFPILKKFDIKNKKNKDNDIFNLIYVGGLTKQRGITQIVQAMEYLPDNIKLTLLGKFSSKEYEETVKASGGFQKTEYAGQVSYDIVIKGLIGADVGLVCPWPVKNYYNAAGLTKMFEYMAAALPIIASNFPLWKEIIEGNNCGICVNPLEPKEIARAIEYLIEHPDEARKMGENGRKVVLEKYNWENESKKLLKVYEGLYEI